MRLFILSAIISLLVIPQFASASDLDELKAADQKLTQAWNDLDAETTASMFAEGAVAFTAGGAFPLVAPMESTQAERAEFVKAYLETFEYLSIYPYNPQYRVFGNTGVVWGHVTVDYKEKGEPGKTMFLRYLSTWIKSDGMWLLVADHESVIPQGD